ncbi:MAG: hypothetical protein JWM56_523 [Candidatus Peribacteria bacterium]|nr:hypothetical protein [Candidatus Peribacteria bacterium]
MKNDKNIKGIDFSKKLYRKLLNLYPVTFRKEYDASMEQVFANMLCDAKTERKSLFIPWLRVIKEMPLSIFQEHMATPTVGSPKKITLQFWLPSFQSVVSAVLVFGIQMGMFLAGVFLLYSSYHPQIPESLQAESDWILHLSLYPYLLIEITIFLCASLVAFWISRWQRRTKTILFAVEMGILLFAQLVSSIWGYACTILIDVSHFPALGTPRCGISSINVSSFGFVLFCAITLVLWIFLLNTAVRREAPSS